VAEQLCTAAIELAMALGAGSINLTSNPKRVAANKLYLKLGFKVRDTNNYTYSLRS